MHITFIWRTCYDRLKPSEPEFQLAGIIKIHSGLMMITEGEVRQAHYTNSNRHTRRQTIIS